MEVFMPPVVIAQTVSITFNVGEVVTWIVIGLIAGSLAGLIVRGSRFGYITSLIVGLVGALVGGFLFKVLQIPVSPALENAITIKWIDIIVAFVGAVIVLLIVGGFYRLRGR
jgi:uncharacterized membrane protein YeaQ/YmgE (transglycosylase-associated protein family)